ncbi:MAG: LCP family protein [Clostridia bacterium]|jgi:LCP family protein required for cell wall assembly|nr:LCP family protein [Clostridia bacterium]
MRLTRRKRYYLRRVFFWLDVILVLALLTIGVYVVYDRFFRLPSPSSSPVSDSATEEKLAFDKFNILLLGLDGREGLNDRSDTIILVSLDEKNKKAQLLSIPRDTRVKVRGKLDKINAAYAYGGVDLSLKTVSNFLGVHIDRYVIIKFDGLVKLVDLAGGIDVHVPTRMYKPSEGIDLYPGDQHLDGEQVLAYTRFRNDKYGDLDRARRQQEALQLLATKILKEKSLSQLVEFINLAFEEVETDLSMREMVALARLASPVLENGVVTKILPGQSVKINEIWYYEADLANLPEVLAIVPTETLKNS